ncbi:alpha/beta fold hydrolase [Rhizobiales bacterium]|uniref:alpha/beta fold hydrolase n=1 Tax=Hongsoonwoonella zoysiae TaxID=2821844 RepID=UPI001560B0A5|nr:alpha/beta fold hydrolase [Hongsoonwoonella zoysiae]NRG16350.1 alpha/beta fold hydrolase [Hongsoonwoonella zoysiae]
MNAFFGETDATPATSCSQRGLAQPVYLGGLAAMLHAGEGDTGALFLSPWGYEELCARKTFRLMGERLAAAGFPSLRFDYPTTGDSGGEENSETGWIVPSRGILDDFRSFHGLKRVIVLGQGIGCLYAAHLAATDPTVAGLVLLAPPASGRGYLREVAAWTSFTRPTFLVGPDDGPEGSLTAAGFVLSKEVALEAKMLSVKKEDLPAKLPTLFVARPDHPGDAALTDHLSAAGCDLTVTPFEGYAEYVSDPTLSQVPEGVIEAVAGWAEERFEHSGPPIPGRTICDEETSIEPASGVREEMLRFGKGKRLFGVFAEPCGANAKTAVLFLNSGYDHHCGWANVHVSFARALASNGIASLRIDLSNIGESPPWPDQKAQVLYSDRQIDDVKAAIDELKARGIETVIVYGRCSGAYLALLSAVADERIDAMVMVNSRRFAWNPKQDVDTELKKPVQPLSNYTAKMRDPAVLKRALSSPEEFRKAAGKLASGLSRPFMKAIAPALGPLSMHNRLDKLVHARMAALKRRGVAALIIYSEKDPGLEELQSYFGPDQKRIKAYGNVQLTFLPDADHNLTPAPARAAVLGRLTALARALDRRERLAA